MDFKALGQTIVKLGAPLLGTALAGPAGAAIGQIIASEFGGTTTDVAGLASLITTDPAAQAKLAEIQSNMKIQLQQLLVTNAQNELAATTAQVLSDNQNTEDARKLVAVSIMPAVVTFIVIAGFFACFGGLLVYASDIQESVSSVLYMMVGSISSAFGGAIAFWLGSSSSSRNKDQALHSTLVALTQNSSNK